MNREVSSVLESDSRAAHGTGAHAAVDPFGDPPATESPLVRFLYPAPARRRTAGGIFKWWESRRLAYNVIVGAGGALTMSIATVFSQIVGQPMAVSQLLAPVLPIAIMANICYTLGPLTEWFLHRLWGTDVQPSGPHLFRAGLILSAGATFLLPTLLMGFALVLWLVRGIFGLF